MLTVTALTNAEYLLGSVALGIDEYYAGVGEAPGVWMGQWSSSLGVAGVVEADVLRALIDALHLTRVDRVQRLADGPTQLHLDVLGPVPAGTAGRAVWCHQANRLERHLDHAIRDDTMWQGLVNDLSVTPTLARIADSHIAILHHHEVRPTDWAPITQQATAMHAATIEHGRPAPQRGFEIELGL